MELAAGVDVISMMAGIGENTNSAKAIENWAIWRSFVD
jgi:hypothetical protein